MILVEIPKGCENFNKNDQIWSEFLLKDPLLTPTSVFPGYVHVSILTIPKGKKCPNRVVCEPFINTLRQLTKKMQCHEFKHGQHQEQQTQIISTLYSFALFCF